ncbi:copper amine oxidase N-terminal domain-containing protein [Paenibacillus sp. FSL R10-2734]|uniref:copper amine oxidase N-terminal domain-containing protein n=1 Tax=Paenibacillus sp. FSL R10-2734 TaxID=2954691 RepID=UPI0030DC92E8
MKTFKIIGAVLAGTFLASNVVSAASAPVKPVVISSIPQDSIGGQKLVLVINGSGFSPVDVPLYAGSSKEVMIPIRTAAEALGYKLTWNQGTQSLGLVKDSHSLSFQVGKDTYRLDTTLVPLGAVPELKNGKTYVPLSFFEKVMKLDVMVGPTGTVSITSKGQGSEETPSDTIKQGSITSIYKGEKNAEIGLNGYGHGVRLGISDETEIVSADNKKLTFADLQLGMSIEVEHSMVMAMSMPPLTSAIKIVVKEQAPNQQTLGTAGVIEEVTPVDNGLTRVVIKGDKLSDDSVDTIVLNLSSTTPIFGTKDNKAVAASELKKGDKVYAFYGPVLTRSLPPIGQVTKIVVEN